MFTISLMKSSSNCAKAVLQNELNAKKSVYLKAPQLYFTGSDYYKRLEKAHLCQVMIV